MPRPSGNPDNAREGGSGVEAGNYAVVAAKYQNLKTDFKPNQPYLVFECATLDSDGDAVRGADPVEIRFAYGEKALDAFHPGQAEGPDDEPVDQTDTCEAEGNTIYCATGSEQFSGSCSAVVFAKSLAKAGFPKNILDRCWAPDYVGLKFTLATRTSKELNERMGTRLNTKPTADGGTFTYKVADKWLNPNYLSNGNGAKSASAKTAKAEKAEKAEPATDKSDSKSSKGSNDLSHLTEPEEMCKEVLAVIAKERPGAKNKIQNKQSLMGFFTNVFTRTKCSSKKLAQCQKMIRDEEWVIGALAELGAIWDEGTVEFPEA